MGFLSRDARTDESFAQTELRINLFKEIEKLSPEHRAVIILREVEGLSYAEISETVGCSKGTVMSRLHHARKKLQQSLLTVFKREQSELDALADSSGTKHIMGK